MARSEKSRNCLQAILKIYDEGFNLSDLPEPIRLHTGGLVRASYIKPQHPPGKDYTITREGWRYARREGWI